ncbi:MAG TPA: sterol desaturase family protein [Alphaproteobacteria bacterium]|jgi:sterol desaturase/sphingolipid hydroxylase (fatty acid hydroxylase superfamily)|nr:sterol desaturase family protein [Alphaproteobacteria bacterium]
MFDKLLNESVGLPQVQHLMVDWSGGIVIFVALLMGAELLLRTSEWWTARKAGIERDLLPKDAIANLMTTSIYNLTLRTFGAGVMLLLGFVAYQHSHWRIPLTWWTLPAYVLAAEFWSYFFHRMMHEMRLFWADHSVHHSSEEFDFTTAQRFHLLEWVPKVIVYVPLAAVGFHPGVLFLFTILAGIQLIAHTARFGRWGWWDTYFVSPTIHGVHHARNPIYMDRNLGGALNFWDHVFGTYQNATEEKLIYGITHHLREDTKVKVPFTGWTVTLSQNNPIKVLFWEYSFLARDLWHAPTFKDKFIVLFGRPGETFEAPPKGAHGDVKPASGSLPADAVAA